MKIRYVAKDGTIFNNKKECAKYERILGKTIVESVSEVSYFVIKNSHVDLVRELPKCKVHELYTHAEKLVISFEYAKQAKIKDLYVTRTSKPISKDDVTHAIFKEFFVTCFKSTYEDFSNVSDENIMFLYDEAYAEAHHNGEKAILEEIERLARIVVRFLNELSKEENFESEFERVLFSARTGRWLIKFEGHIDGE